MDENISIGHFNTLFYFHYVEGNRSRDEQYWQHHFADRSGEAWEGFTFEEVCLRHLPQIKFGLGISGMPTEFAITNLTTGRGACHAALVASAFA